MQIDQDSDKETSTFSSATEDVASVLKNEAVTAANAFNEARDEVTRKAGEYASEAKAAAFTQAEGAQKDVGATLGAFGEAMRAASEHLANEDQRAMSKLLLDTAEGIERLAGSLRTKRFEDILGDVRAFGRENSGALFAGSMLAGLALGRFVKSSAPRTSSTAESKSPEKSPGPEVHEAMDTGNESSRRPSYE